MEDSVIPTVVKTKLDHPDSLMVSANVIHQPVLADFHNRRGIALPYLPELYPVKQPSRNIPWLSHDWRASDLPRWDGPPDFSVQKGFRPPFQGHRWLLASDDEGADNRTYVATTINTANGPGWDSWTVHAQQHYSFLHHLERGDLHRYKFPLWVNPSGKVSHDFVCMWGADMDMIEGSQKMDIIIDGKIGLAL
ncbi:hypothetical protein VTN96DRAFT_8908 [Rasamsonia emersonii]